MEMSSVRFDDLSSSGSGSFGLRGRRGEIIATRPVEVIPALEEAERAANSGLWVAGFVAYEAAMAFDEALPVHPRGLHDTIRHVPLVHFGVFKRFERFNQPQPDVPPAGDYHLSNWTPDARRSGYHRALEVVGEAIRRGDLQWIKPTFRLRAAFAGDPGSLYRDLLLAQKGGYASCVDTGRLRVVSASPEGFFEIHRNIIRLKPIIGTVPRGRWPDEDERFARELMERDRSIRANEQLTAQLEEELRSITEVGEIRTAPQPRLERLETVWHLTTDVTARLRPGVGIADVFRALFPPASITGVPKRTAMELIAALEGTSRGVYCGAVGFLSPPEVAMATASFSVAIRTVVVDESEGVAEFGVGGGIGASEEIAGAYEEARVKARLLVERRPGFAIFEDIRWDDGYRLGAAHVARLVASADYFGYPIDRAELDRLLAIQSSRLGEPTIVRVMAARNGRLTVETRPAGPWVDGPGAGSSISLAVSEQPVASSNVYLFHRTSNTHLFDQLRKMHPSTDEVLLFNEERDITQTTAGNLLLDFGSGWVTPPIGSGCFPGIMRSRLVEQGRVRVERVGLESLGKVHRLAVIDAVHGRRPAHLTG